MYRFEVIKIKGRYTVVRVWDVDTFPINPIKGLDFKTTGVRITDNTVLF